MRFLKIVQNREALGQKKWNMKFWFCRRILDISGQWLLKTQFKAYFLFCHYFKLDQEPIA